MDLFYFVYPMSENLSFCSQRVLFELFLPTFTSEWSMNPKETENKIKSRVHEYSLLSSSETNPLTHKLVIQVQECMASTADPRLPPNQSVLSYRPDSERQIGVVVAHSGAHVLNPVTRRIEGGGFWTLVNGYIPDPRLH